MRFRWPCTIDILHIDRQLFPIFIGWQNNNYSDHLITEHLKSEHLTFWTLFCPVFRWSDHMIRRTIWRLDFFDHKTDIFWSGIQTTIWKPNHLTPDMFGRLEYQTCPVFRWLMYWTSPVFKWSKVVQSPNGIQMPYEYRIKFILVFKWRSEYQASEYWLTKVCYSDVSVFQIFIIQIPSFVR